MNLWDIPERPDLEAHIADREAELAEQGRIMTIRAAENRRLRAQRIADNDMLRVARAEIDRLSGLVDDYLAASMDARLENDRLRAVIAELAELLESHTNALHAAEARLADVIALCDRIDDGLRPGWPSTAFRAAATGDTK